MFQNVVSTQDLLSDSQRTNYSSDSALFSLSQKQQSQNEFSQVRTQDLFTQNPMNGSQSENSFPPTKKMSMFDKWTSREAMYRKDQTNRSKTASSSQSSYQQNLFNKPRENENRDLLQQVVNIVQDCNREVKGTLVAVKQKLESDSELSGEKLHATVKAFLEDIWKHGDRMLQAVEKGNEAGGKLHELEKQLAVKEVEVQQLQARLEERGRPEDLKQMAKAVRQEMLSPHLAVENKLMEILEVAREASEQQSEQQNEYKSQMKAHTKQYSEWKAFNQRLIKDMEKRLQQDITALRKDLQKGEQEWQSMLQEQLTEASSLHTQDMEKLIERLVSESSSRSDRQSTNSSAAMFTLIAGVKREMQNTLQRQTKAMEKNLQDMLVRHVQKQQQQLQNLHETFVEDMTARIESVTDQQEQKENNRVEPLTVPVFEEKIEEYHTSLRQQLTDLHKEHMLEVKTVHRELQPQDCLKGATSITRRPFPTSATFSTLATTTTSECGPKAGGCQVQNGRGMARICPLSQADRSGLFTKARPSPVVAVLPQQQHVQPSHSKTEVNSDYEISFSRQPPQSVQPSKKAKEGKKRKKGGGNKWSVKKGKKNGQRKTVDEAVESPPHQHAVKVTRSKRMDVYDFSQQQSPDQNHWQFSGFHLQRNDDKRNQLCSPQQSITSCVSSPAVSISADKDIILVRRYRHHNGFTPERSNRCSEMEVSDMLSSPSMMDMPSQTSFPKDQVETARRELRTRSKSKRSL